MAIKKTIELEINSKSLGNLEEQLEGVNRELREVEVGSDRFKELTKQSQLLNKEITKINDEIDGFQLEDKLMAADGAAKIFGGSLAAAVGTLGTLGIESEAFGEFEEKAASAIAVGLGIKDVSEGFGQVAVAAKKSGVATKLFGSTTRTAIAATGIGVFALALGAIVSNWDSINKGVKRFVNNTPFIGTAIDTIKGAFDSLFNAAKPVLRFLGILPSEAEIASNKIKETVSLTIQELEREIAIAQAAGKSVEEIYKLRRKLMQLELQQMRDSNAEKEDIFKKETELLALEAAEQKRIREENANSVEREKVKTVSAIKSVGVQQIETNAEVKADSEITANASVEYEKLTAEQKLNIAGDAFGNLAAIAGEQSAVGKAAAIAQTTISTYQGAQESYKALAGIPVVGPALGALAAAAAVAGGVAQVKAINSVKTPFFGGTKTISAPAAPQPPAFNVVGAGGGSQIAQAIGEKDQQPVKAYVVSQDVTTAQSLDRNIIESASIG